MKEGMPPRKWPLHAVILVASMACGWVGASPVGVSTPDVQSIVQPLTEQDAQRLDAAIGAAVHAQMDAGALPGAVVLIGNAQGVVFRQAYGWRALAPAPERMTTDTVFDLASLTKAVVTTTAIMQLAEHGTLALDAPAARYWAAFAAKGKEHITVAQLLAHTSGLRPDIDLSPPWQGREAALLRVLAETPRSPPGTRMVYSDINFMVLGELVQRVSGLTLPDYAQRYIFGPLHMADTGFMPADKARIAPTETLADGTVLRGITHDPVARRMGGWAGHAGAFGTADDLARFAQAILRSLPSIDAQSGEAMEWPDVTGAPHAPGVPSRQAGLFSQATLARMMSLQSPDAQPYWRGLGWAIGAPLVANRDALPAMGVIDHTGYTGTGLWIDLFHRSYVVILSNRVYPDGQGDARPLRRQILGLLASQRPPVTTAQVNAVLPFLAAMPAHAPPPPPPADAPAVMTGIDVLEAQNYAPLQGQRVGLITNLSAVDRHGWRTLDRLRWSPGMQLLKVFTPEHGLNRDLEGRIASGFDMASGLPIVSLYGRQLRPTRDMLHGLDTLVFDIQDAGVRFYTFMSTMGEAMQAAAEAGLDFVVLDRPDPIGADRVAGPMLDADMRSFTAYAPMPIQHGMTIGELARWFADDMRQRTGREVKLHVVPMEGYRRDMLFKDTRLDWIPPSPNLRTPTTALLYPGVAWIEGANVSVGRGTARPFEWIGAPWIDARRLAQALNDENLAGIEITPARFVPDGGPYQGQVCEGVQFRVLHREAYDAQLLGLALARNLYRLWPAAFQIDQTLPMIGSRQTLAQIKAGRALAEIALAWQSELSRFARLRSAYLLY